MSWTLTPVEVPVGEIADALVDLTISPPSESTAVERQVEALLAAACEIVGRGVVGDGKVRVSGGGHVHSGDDAPDAINLVISAVK